MLKDERGICMFRLQPISVIINGSNQLNKFWMSCSSITKKECIIFINSKMRYFNWNAKILLKTSNNALLFGPTFLILLSKPLERKIFI